MKRKVILVSFVLGLAILSQNVFAGGGWVNKRGTGFLKLNQFFTFSDEFILPSGEVREIPRTSIYTTSLYLEYGLTDRFTGVAYFPFYSRSTLNSTFSVRDQEFRTSGDEFSDIGDSFIGLKYGLFQDEEAPIKVSLGLIFGLAFGEESGGQTGLLQTGDGEYNQLIQVEASHSFYPVPAYITARVGFNNRTKGFSEEFQYGLELGYKFKEKLTTSFILSGVESFQNGSAETRATNGIFSNNTEFLTLRPGLSYDVNSKFGIEGGAIFVASGRQILGDPAYEIGVFMKF